MGKGVNASHTSDGLYTVDYEYDTAAITALITKLTATLAELNSEQGTITSDISSTESDISSLETTVKQNIDDLNDLKAELADFNSDLDAANDRLDEIPDEIAEQNELLVPIDARMLVIAIFLSPIQASIASKQAELAEATDPDEIARLTAEISALQAQETILAAEYDDLAEEKLPITTEISDLESEQTELNGTVSTLEGDISSKESAIDTLTDTKESNEDNLKDYRKDLLQFEVDLALNKLKITSTQKALDEANAIPTSLTGQFVWCADLTEDLSGEVGLMEVAGFEDSGVNIQPGYEGNAVYDAARDGITTPVAATMAAQAYFNKAMQGGWQKWKPTYRWGTITAIDYDLDTCSLEMSVATNPDTSLDVNQASSLTGVPIEYMSCNAAPFSVGDTVVVKFNGQSWDDPVVIGFTSEPKGCGWSETWEDGICGQHRWRAGWTGEDCPSLPVDLYTANGSFHVWIDAIEENYTLHIETRSAPYGGGNGIYIFTDDDNDKTQPTVGDMVVKCKALEGSHLAGVYVSTSAATIRLSITSTAFPAGGITHSSIIGDNGGEEQTVDLTQWLTSGDKITSVFIVENALNGGSAGLSIDYIIFA